MVTFSFKYARNERIIAIFAFRIRSFWIYWANSFRTILKYDNNNTRMTEATKLTPDKRGH